MKYEMREHVMKLCSKNIVFCSLIGVIFLGAVQYIILVHIGEHGKKGKPKLILTFIVLFMSTFG